MPFDFICHNRNGNNMEAQYVFITIVVATLEFIDYFIIGATV